MYSSELTFHSLLSGPSWQVLIQEIGVNVRMDGADGTRTVYILALDSGAPHETSDISHTVTGERNLHSVLIHVRYSPTKKHVLSRFI